MNGNVAPLLVREKRVHLETSELCNCESPVIILHPNIKSIICQHRNYTYMGKYHDVVGHRLYPHFETFFKSGKYMDIEDLDKCYVSDRDTGEIIPMYLLVPCGHCDICKNSKVSSFAHRCVLESQMYQFAPWFVTLTYDNSHLPKDGSRLDHIQLFLKRFRSRFDYHGIPFKIRYVAVSEYGHNTHRIHYHLLIWNLPNWKFFKVSRWVRKSWKMGIVYCSQVSSSYIVKGTKHFLSKPEKCFEYVAKYLCKDCVVPEGKNPTFFITSRRHGGIGAPFIDQHAAYIRRHRRYTFEFIDKFTQVKQKLVYNKYVLNRLYPTLCQSIPVELRRAVVTVCRYCNIFSRPEDVDYIEQFTSRYSHRVIWPELTLADWKKFVHFPEYSRPRWVRCRDCSLMRDWYDRCISILIRYFHFDFDTAFDLSSKRQYICDKLNINKHIRYFYPQVQRIRKFRDVAHQRELL